MKKKDLFFIIALTIVLGVGYYFYNASMHSDPHKQTKTMVEIYYKKDKIESVDISIDKIYTFQGSYGKFSLEVKDRKYHAINVECPNHDCEKMGWMKEGSSKPITCVPNEIYVIQAGTEDQID